MIVIVPSSLLESAIVKGIRSLIGVNAKYDELTSFSLLGYVRSFDAEYLISGAKNLASTILFI